MEGEKKDKIMKNTIIENDGKKIQEFIEIIRKWGDTPPPKRI